MAILHRATLVPTKAELMAAWLPDQAWFTGEAGVVTPLGSYRFDDPAGQVGVESHVVEVGGRTWHVPLTYRGQPLEGGERWLVGTMSHSVLGPRWVYDGLGDPVYRAEVVRVIREADTQVEMFVETPEGPQRSEPTMHVRGSGGAVPDAPEIVVVREPGAGEVTDPGAALTGTWPGRSTETVLVRLV